MAQKTEQGRLTKELRTALKNTLHQEIEKLPELFSKLDAKERLDMLIKFLPYILPKVETVHYTENEPNNFGWNMD